MLCNVSISLLVIANLLIPAAILIFASGFFPYKPFLPGRAQYHVDENDSISDPPFDKVIFMVVDALRSDFVYSTDSGFHFTQSLIRSGAAIPFTAHATPPTITMPRVKAITTGSIPSFLDVILNFAESDASSTLTTQDNWPFQLKAKPGGRLVMYGDDTWLRLFPDTFFRSDGTTSFFVSDFTEVDRNVTRHVPTELDHSDWNGMIMHYLGLDHIGHKSGPRSPHMIPKHHEMDAIVQQIYQALQTKDHLKSTLLVLCGDHGMNDAGNHGGSGPGETSPALVFMSPKLEDISFGTPCPLENPKNAFQYYNVIEQSDVAPTLAGLLGFPIPLNNLGIFIPEFLRFWSESESVVLMTRNAQQILRIVQATFSDIAFDGMVDWARCTEPDSDAKQLQCQWAVVKALQDDQNATAERKLSALTKFLRAAQDIMSSTASEYDVSKLQLGIATAAVTACCAVAALAALNSGEWSLWICVLVLSYGAMMFASSYVEEEQHFWYWIASGWLTLLSLKFFLSSTTIPYRQILYLPILLAIQRVLRRWNQTGQKHAGEPDIAKTFLPAHNLLLWIAVTITFLDMARRLVWFGLPNAPCRVAGCASIILCLYALGFKVTYTIADAPEFLTGIPQYAWRTIEEASLVSQARTVFLGIAISMVYNVYQTIKPRPAFKTLAKNVAWSLHDLTTLFLVIQTRLTNIPLFLLFYVELLVLATLNLKPDDITLTSIIFQYSAFFAFGGSNAISSIDLSNAYNGIRGYNVAAVGILTFVSNWAGPIWWASASNLLLLQKNPAAQRTLFVRHIALQTVFTASSLFFVMLACTVLRTHLFIWTVFSPKYLYSMAWSLGQHLAINVVLGSLLFWIGSWDSQHEHQRFITAFV